MTGDLVMQFMELNKIKDMYEIKTFQNAQA